MRQPSPHEATAFLIWQVIEMSGYTVEEKIQIATRHLLPKQLGLHGLGEDQLILPAGTIE